MFVGGTEIRLTFVGRWREMERCLGKCELTGGVADLFQLLNSRPDGT